MSNRILIAGIGNIFHGDDGFGVAVTERLLSRQRQQPPDSVEIIDFGIRGMDLASRLVEAFHAVVMVDALPQGGQPGSLYLIEPTALGPIENSELDTSSLDLHRMDPVTVLAIARTLGTHPIRTFVVGCEPALPVDRQSSGPATPGLSPAVSASVGEAVEIIEALCQRLIREEAGS